MLELRFAIDVQQAIGEAEQCLEVAELLVQM